MTYSHTATCRFTIASWTEAVYVDIDGEGSTMGDTYYPKRGLTRADVSYDYTGDLEGSSVLSYLMAYRGGDDGVLGFEQVTGALGGRTGSFVLRHTGSHTAGEVTAHLEVMAGMGTGDLAGLRGEAELSLAGHSDDGYQLVLSYDL